MILRKENNGIRNTCFDQLKGIACIAVVFMHCEFPGIFGTLVQCLTRWSVPLFFAVSGYFFRNEQTGECFRKAKHILNIILWAVVFYIVFNTVEHVLLGDLTEYIRSEFTILNILALILFNGQFYVSGHLWFLFALLYVYLFYAMFIKTGLNKNDLLISGLLFGCHFMLAYGGFLLGHPLKSGFYRNFLFDGIPSFLLGHFFYHSTVKAQNRFLKPAILIIEGFVIALIERTILGRDFSLHVGSVITLYGMMMWAKEDIPLRTGKWLAKLGGGISTYVYVLHIAVYRTIDFFSDFLGVEKAEVVLWIRPVLTVVISILISATIFYLKDKKQARISTS